MRKLLTYETLFVSHEVVPLEEAYEEVDMAEEEEGDQEEQAKGDAVGEVVFLLHRNSSKEGRRFRTDRSCSYNPVDAYRVLSAVSVPRPEPRASVFFDYFERYYHCRFLGYLIHYHHH